MVLDDHWRRWIAENLLLGTETRSILAALVKNGFDESVCRNEIEAAANSPYLQGVCRAVNRVAKRDWVLKSLGKLFRLSQDNLVIPKRHKLPRGEFLRDFYAANRPVIITGMMDDWPALTKWSPAYLRDQFGDRQIEVQFGRSANPRYEVDSPKLKRVLALRDYVDLVQRSGETNDYYMTANNSSRNYESLRELWDDIVQIPEYLDGAARERGFFWFGPAGTITPLHHDLTNNFMAQVCGRKLVKLIPPWDLPYLYNDFHCYTDVDLGRMDSARFPQFGKATIVDCVLSPGELLFLPVGWWHYVQGLDITMTVSFVNFAFDNDFSSFYTTYRDV